MPPSTTVVVFAATGQAFGDNTALDLLLEKLEPTCSIVIIGEVGVRGDVDGRCVKLAEHVLVTLITVGKGTYNTDLFQKLCFPSSTDAQIFMTLL
jgi:hypothetical protein